MFVESVNLCCLGGSSDAHAIVGAVHRKCACPNAASPARDLSVSYHKVGTRLCAVAHCEIGRQKARAPQLHLADSRTHSLQDNIAAEGQAAEALDQAYDDQASLRGRNFVPEKF